MISIQLSFTKYTHAPLDFQFLLKNAKIWPHWAHIPQATVDLGEGQPPPSCGVSTPVYPSPHHPGVLTPRQPAGAAPQDAPSLGSRVSPAWPLKSAGAGEPSCRSTGPSGRRRSEAALVPTEEGILPRGRERGPGAPGGGQPLHAFLGQRRCRPRGTAEAGKKVGLARGGRPRAARHWQRGGLCLLSVRKTLSS